MEDLSSSFVYQVVCTALCFLCAIWSRLSELFWKIYELTSNFYAIVTEQGLGRDENHISLLFFELLDKWFFILDLCWLVDIWFVKSSILAFYWRLFGPNRRAIRLVIWVLTALVTCWGVSVVRFRPLVLMGRAGLSRRHSLMFNDFTAACHNIWVYSFQWTLQPRCSLCRGLLHTVMGLCNTPYRHGFTASSLSGTTDLETSNAQIKKVDLDGNFCFG